MATTPLTLLQRLKDPADRDARAWLVELYTPLLFSCATRILRLPKQDAEDLVQEVFLILFKGLPHFEYDPSRSFRSWLHTVTVNKYRELLRRRLRDAAAHATAINDDGDLFEKSDWVADGEYRSYLLNRAWKLIRSDFEPQTQAAFEHYVPGAADNSPLRKCPVATSHADPHYWVEPSRPAIPSGGRRSRR